MPRITLPAPAPESKSGSASALRFSEWLHRPECIALRGRTARVTGSTRGIGLGIAAALREAGCYLVLNSRGGEGERVAEQLAWTGGVSRVRYVEADLHERNATAALLAAYTARIRAPDILVNNIGIQHIASIPDFPDERWDEIIALNLSSASPPPCCRTRAGRAGDASSKSP